MQKPATSLNLSRMILPRSRDRFEREFIRAKNADAKLYLLIENGTWEKAYAGNPRTAGVAG